MEDCESEALTPSREDKSAKVATNNNTNKSKVICGLLTFSAIVFLTTLLVLLILVILEPLEGQNALNVEEATSTTIGPVKKLDLPDAERLMKAVQSKLESSDKRFNERFPRDYRKTATRNLRRFLPRPLKSANLKDLNLNNEEKIDEILTSLDVDGDEAAGPWELYDWMLYVEKIVHRHVVDEQWKGLGQQEEDVLKWPDYVMQLNPNGRVSAKLRKRTKRDRRRWEFADNDGDGSLNKREFRRFLFPHLGGEASAAGLVLVPEAHEDLDADYDGRVSEAEFVAVHYQNGGFNGNRSEAVYFRQALDADGNGFLDLEELVQWVEPTGFVQAKSEVIYLLQHLDSDGSKNLTLTEVQSDPETFLTSQVTFFGQIYSLQNLRQEIFRFP